MALRVLTTIRNMAWPLTSDMNGLEDDYSFLEAAEMYGWECEVDAKACDGYYDVIFISSNGYWPTRKIAALSWFHLDGFTVDGPAL